MAKPLRLPGVEERRMLQELEIRLLVRPTQLARWNRLVKEWHSLRSASLVGKQCRYAVRYRGKSVALLGLSEAALHLVFRVEEVAEARGWPTSALRRDGCGKISVGSLRRSVCLEAISVRLFCLGGAATTQWVFSGGQFGYKEIYGVTPVSLRSARKRHPWRISVVRCGRASESVGERKRVSHPQPAAVMVC